MYILIVILILFNSYSDRLFGKQLGVKASLIFTFIIYTTIFFNYEYLLNLDFFLRNKIVKILTFSIYKEIKVIYVLLLALVILFSFNNNKLVKKFSDFYFSFLISVFVETKLPNRFIFITFYFGFFLGRLISMYLNLPTIDTFLLIFGLGALTPLIVYLVLTSFFILGTYYSEAWGNSVFSYLLTSASESIREKVYTNSSTYKKKKKSNLKQKKLKINKHNKFKKNHYSFKKSLKKKSNLKQRKLKINKYNKFKKNHYSFKKSLKKKFVCTKSTNKDVR